MHMPLRRTVAAFATLTLVSTALPLRAEELPGDIAARADTVHLKPSGKWNVDFGENKCSLERDFEYGGEKHVLHIEQDAPDDGFRLVVAGPALAKLGKDPNLAWALRSDVPLIPDPRKATTEVPGFGPAVVLGGITLGRLKISMTRDGIALHDEDNKPNADGTYLSHGEISTADAAKVERIVFADLKGGAAVSIDTGNMKSAFAALNTCTADLLTSWGLDPAQHRSYVPPRLLNIREAIALVSRSIPRGAASGQRMSYRLIVETDGKVSNCHIEAGPKVEGTEQFCQALMRSLKMAPARDAEGKPIRSFFASGVARASF